MDNVSAAGSGAVASQGPTAPSAGTTATPFAGPVAPTPSSAATAAGSPPTMILPRAHARRGRHFLSHIASESWLRRLVVIACVTFAVSLATAAAMLLTGGSADRSAAPTGADTSATADASLEPTTEPLPSPTSEPEPSPTAVQAPRQRPADLIAGIQAGLTQLIRDGQLEEHSAEDLQSRLEDVADALADGETDEAWEDLRKAAKELNNLREDGDVTTAGYQSLAAALTQLANTLPAR